MAKGRVGTTTSSTADSRTKPRTIIPCVGNHVSKRKTRRRHGCLLGCRCYGERTRRHDCLLGGRCHSEKRCKRWLCEKRCKRWRCEKRQWASIKSAPPRRSASLASPSAPHARTHTTTGSSPLVRGISILCCYHQVSSSCLIYIYIYIIYLHAPALYCAIDFEPPPTRPNVTEGLSLPPCPALLI